MPGALPRGMAVEVRHSSVELRKRWARRSYWWLEEVMVRLKRVVVNVQFGGGV